MYYFQWQNNVLNVVYKLEGRSAEEVAETTRSLKSILRNYKVNATESVDW